MTILNKLRSRYLQDSIPVRLGGLAANLARVASFSKHDGYLDALSATLQESKWFIEWTAAELETKDIAELVRLQTQMALWQLQSQKRWNDNNWRAELSGQAQSWSQRILQMSGLLKA
jgi:hypothetical protein